MEDFRVDQLQTDGSDTHTRDQSHGTCSMSRMKAQICYDFTKGNCQRGAQCRFSHNEDHIKRVNSTNNRGVCFEHLRGVCQRGKLCKFNHDLSHVTAQQQSVIGNVNATRICFDFVKGCCGRGEMCPYSHSLSLISQIGPAHRGQSAQQRYRPPQLEHQDRTHWDQEHPTHRDQQQLIQAQEYHQQQMFAYEEHQMQQMPMPSNNLPTLLPVTSESSESSSPISPNFSLDQIKAIWNKIKDKQ